MKFTWLILKIIAAIVLIVLGGQNLMYKNKIGQINQRATTMTNNYYFNNLPKDFKDGIKDIQTVSGDSAVIQ